MAEFFLELFSEETPSSLQKICVKICWRTLRNYLVKDLFPLKKAHHTQHQIEQQLYLKVFKSK